MRTFLYVFLFVFFFNINGAHAETQGVISKWISTVSYNAKNVWDNGSYELYVPVNIWHNRLAYDKKKIRRYNEAPWGLGAGKYVYDEDGNWHSLYFMVFKDSNYHPETMFGYGYQHNWYLDEEKNWRYGIGYTIGATQRCEYKYIPVPLPLPLVGIGYKHFSLQAAYVPGVKNDGNVLFTWLTVQF